MKVTHYRDIPPDPVGEEGASGITVRHVISEKDGADNFSMRVFQVEPGGYSPYHKHPWEHEVFILEGTAEVVSENGKRSAPAGEVVFVLPDEYHQFRNETGELLRFICLIPNPE